MKEHTLFAVVILVLAIGYMAFDTTKITGEVTEQQRLHWRGSTFEEKSYDGQKYVSYENSPSYSATLGSLSEVGSVFGRFVGSPRRRFNLNDGREFPNFGKVDQETLRVCINQITRYGNCVDYESADKTINSVRLRPLCSPVEYLDVDGDGRICRRDETHFKTLYYGSVGNNENVDINKLISCVPGLNKDFYSYGVSGYVGWVECVEIDDTYKTNPHNPNPYKKSGVYLPK